MLVLPATHDWSRELGPDEYNLLSRKKLRRKFGFDVFVASENSPAYYVVVEFFGRVRDNPLVRKGMVRIEL